MKKENKPMFSLVMPMFRDDERTIRKAIDSIIDQDVTNWELIVIINGQWKDRNKTEKIVEKYTKKDKRISLIKLNAANSCTARNAGADVAKGDFVAFFSSDFYMYPGALRKWKKTFDQQPEADFIYSGYGLMKDGKMVANTLSEPFDPWRLRIENYIDGGFPMRRKVSEKCKWNPDVKSLNDWDFWLTVIDKGFKGYYMPDFTYAAEVPKEGGLSSNSAKNWLERVSQIKALHNIKERDICVVSLGAQPHGKRIAKLLKADFKTTPQWKPHKYKAIYLIGFYIGNGDSAVAHTSVFKDMPPGCKKVIHWIGTDILQLLSACYKVNYADMKSLIDLLKTCINISEFDQTERELLSIGINSQVVALPIEQDIEVMPLPKKFACAIYTPKTITANQIYNLDLMKDIIKACPDIQFNLFGGGLMDFKQPNVKNYGWVEKDDYYNKLMANSSCLMRIAYHDGMPVAPLEFRMAGRDAITTVQMRYIHFAGTGIIHEQNYSKRKEVLIGLLRAVKKEQKKFGVKDVQEARTYYRDLTSPKKFRKAIEKIVYSQ
jgi:glycosyltransferase involved in cell wall biosynthesis